MTIRLDSLRKGTPTATNVALLLLGLITVEFCRTGVHEFHHFVHGYSESVFAQIVVYLGAISLVERCPTNKWTLRIILAIALAARLFCAFAPPFLSSDIYRYVWDGKVQAAGINPFRYIPADSHLAFLRDRIIYPNINRADYAHTIYPPGAQFLFLCISRLSATVTFMKLAMIGFEAITCFFLLKICKLLELSPERVVIYAWHPLCFWEIASSGHVDAAAVTFLTLAIYARLRNDSGMTGLWLGAATLIKLYPAALIPAFFQRGKWNIPLAFASLVAVGYACYSSVGGAVFGFLPAYAQEEGLDSGMRYFLLAFVNRSLHLAISPIVYVLICAIVMAGVCIWALQLGSQPRAFLFSGLVLATMLNVFYSPHYPWYFLWLLPYLAVVPWRPAFYYVTASAYLFGTNLGAPGEPLYKLNLLLYGGFGFMLACELLPNIYKRFSLNSARGKVASSTLISHTANARNL